MRAPPTPAIYRGRQEARIVLWRDVFLWREEGKMHAHISTNASRAMLLRRLSELGIGDQLEELTVQEDLLRLGGVDYAIARWSSDVPAALLREKLPDL
jgi:hypothetical protein